MAVSSDSSSGMLRRPIEVITPLGRDVFLLVGFSGQETLSRPFQFHLEMLVEKPKKIAFDEVLGRKATVQINLPGGKKRAFNGLVSRISQGESDFTFTTFRMELVPQIWLLSRRAQSRIFQHLSVPQIIREVLKPVPDLKVEYHLSGDFRPRDFCVQYRETDFNFFSRLLEEEGIYYFFRHADKDHTLVLANSPANHPELEPAKLLYENVEGVVADYDRIYDWEKFQEMRSGKLTLRDHCFERAHEALEGTAAGQTDVVVGRVQHKLKVGGNEGLEIYEYPGEFAQRFDGVQPGGTDRSGSDAEHIDRIPDDAKRTAHIRMQEETLPSIQIQGAGYCAALSAGFKFTKCNLPSKIEDGEYVVTSVSHSGHFSGYRSGGDGDFDYHNSFTCIPFALPYRPLRLTAKPIVHGTQTAVVVGPSGEEIFTDKYGRVKVQFHWDRQGKHDADSSCWLRVGTLWAGTKWGMIHIPRIGQEVLVDFLEGDPDQPIIVGSVYNSKMMPPYKLPDHKTQSGIKSRSTMNGGEDNFNELRFEDEKGSEDIYFHAEKDFHRVVEHDDDLKVGNDQTIEIKNNRTEVVKEGDETITIAKGNRIEEVSEGNETLTIGKGDRTVTVKQGSDTHAIKQGDRVVKIEMGKDDLKISMGDQKTKVDLGKIETEAMQSIEIKVGQSSIKLEQSGVTIKGMQVKIEGQIQTEIKGTMTTVKADAMLQAKGGVTMIG